MCTRMQACRRACFLCAPFLLLAAAGSSAYGALVSLSSSRLASSPADPSSSSSSASPGFETTGFKQQFQREEINDANNMYETQYDDAKGGPRDVISMPRKGAVLSRIVDVCQAAAANAPRASPL